jgi:hypothetical protein
MSVLNRTIDFKVFCLESYKQAHGLAGVKALQLFKKYGVFGYIDSVYDVLHSTGQGYIVDDIDIYIKARRHAELAT